jgi:hypothetical protein
VVGGSCNLTWLNFVLFLLANKQSAGQAVDNAEVWITRTGGKGRRKFEVFEHAFALLIGEQDSNLIYNSGRLFSYVILTTCNTWIAVKWVGAFTI